MYIGYVAGFFFLLATGLEIAISWKTYGLCMHTCTVKCAWLRALQEDWCMWEERDGVQPVSCVSLSDNSHTEVQYQVEDAAVCSS